MAEVTGIFADALEAFMRQAILTDAGVQAALREVMGGTAVAPSTGGTVGAPGPAGLSAYQLAVQAGFVGSQDQWLDSLQGPQGPRGEVGPVGPAGPQGPMGPAGIGQETPFDQIIRPTSPTTWDTTAKSRPSGMSLFWMRTLPDGSKAPFPTAAEGYDPTQDFVFPDFLQRDLGTGGGTSTQPGTVDTPAATESPFALRVTSSTADSVTVQWDASTAPASGWRIARDGSDSTGYGAWSEAVSGTTAAYTFASLVDGQTYHITLTNLSTNAVETIVFTPTAAKLALAVASSSSGSIVIQWRAPASGATGWRVTRDGVDSTGLGSSSTELPAATTMHTFSGLLPGTTYTLTVTELGSGVMSSIRATPTSAATTSPVPSPATGTALASGLPWINGCFAHSPDRVARFEAKLGRPVDMFQVSPTRGASGWSAQGGLLDTWWLNIPSGSQARYYDVSVPLWQSVAGETLDQASTGQFNAQWEQLGAILAQNAPGSTVRPGWEMNLPNPWAATAENKAQWVAAFRHAYTSLKKGSAGKVYVAWNPNAGGSQTSLTRVEDVYPGDAYVDLIGLDSYDWWEPYLDDASWIAHRDGYGGWNHWLNFTRAHGKKFMVPEFGLAKGDHCGGDNPKFFSYVMPLLEANQDVVYAVSYFDEPDAYIQNSIADDQVPNGGAEYKRQLDRIASAFAATKTGAMGTAYPDSAHPDTTYPA